MSKPLFVLTQTPADPGNIDLLLRMIGAQMVSYFQSLFDKQGSPANSWRPRGTPQKARILSILNERGSDVQIERVANLIPESTSRPALIATQTLKNSITFGTPKYSGGKWSIIVGTNVEYAKQAHEGGEQVIRITDNMRRGIVSLLRRNRELFRFLAWFLHRDIYNFKQPRRPFFVWDDVLTDYVRRVFDEWRRIINGRNK